MARMRNKLNWKNLNSGAGTSTRMSEKVELQVELEEALAYYSDLAATRPLGVRRGDPDALLEDLKTWSPSIKAAEDALQQD